MKKVVMLSMIIMLSVSNLLYAGNRKEKNAQLTDTVSYTLINGKVIDAETSKPVVFATVSIEGKSIGTVSNTDGEFVLKVPVSIKTGNVEITYLGLKNKTVNLSDFAAGEIKTIKMAHNLIPIDAVVIKSIDPLELLETALSRINKNYSNAPEMQTGFYRETIKQNKNYVAVSEAVLDIYKSSYSGGFDYDRMKLFKGRKSRDVKKMDTVLVKLAGGPRTSLLLDVVKNPGDLLDTEMHDYYKYTLDGMVNINDRQAYVVEFKQTENVNYPLYDGRIYIDTESYAIAGIEFRLSDHGLKYASGVLIKKKPASMDIDITGGSYLVNYRMLDGKWYLNYIRSELTLKSKWDKKLFKSNYTAMLEMAVTDRDPENLVKFSGKETAKFNDILVEQVDNFQDSDYWGEYNYIKPDESIQEAVNKLNKKLKRRQ